ncbi:hypothetical protein [Helicobacter trogontum]|uniref:hypothetical protein n=1 Tax=Helicobacter trogontum TaxID=50960 RepID=UPI000CF0CA2D|nr:hypothetical protein [Helicobacter trogontum]
MKKEITEYTFNRFLLKICPFGSLDIYKALEILGGIYHESETADILSDLIYESLENKLFTDIKNIDVCYLAIGHILQKAQIKLNNAGHNIDLHEILNPYYNYLDSGFDCGCDALAQALEIETELENMELLQAIINNEINL